LEVEFDEPLELAKTYGNYCLYTILLFTLFIGACKNRTCASVPSCICDYTSTDVCAGNAPNGCNCPVGLTCAINTVSNFGFGSSIEVVLKFLYCRRCSSACHFRITYHLARLKTIRFTLVRLIKPMHSIQKLNSS
jgi:hypothetical protein